MQAETFWSKLMRIPTTDPEDARRRRLLSILLVGTGIVTLFILLFIALYTLLGLASSQEDILYPLGGALTMLSGIIVIFLINRYGRGWLASTLFLVLLTVAGGLTDPDLAEVVNGRTLAVFVIPILMASVLLRSWASFVMAVGVSLFISVIGLSISIVPNLFAVGIFFMVALVSWLSARSLERVLEDLRRTNQELDQRVDERTLDLAEALAREHAESNRSQAILTGIADGVVVFDKDGRAILANPAIGRLLDRSPEAIIGSDIKALMGKDVDAADKEMIVNLLAEEDLHRSSVKFSWGAKTLSVSFAPVGDPAGGVTGTVAVFRDFTFEAEVDRMKSDFVSIVSHELRTPLTSIKGYLDLISIGASGPVTKQQKSFLAIARDNAERLNELVTDLLDISRIESGKTELNLQVVSVQEIIEEVAAVLKKEFADRELSLTLDLPSDLPEIFGDPARISQIMTNLLSNAYKYTAQGGAIVRAQRTSDAIRVDVVDTGIGISTEDQPKLFTRFFRVDDPMVRQQPGTGLGLHITKSLVEMHGGQLWLQSQSGVGSTFSFTLPLPAGLVHDVVSGEAEGAEAALRPATVALPAGPWILVVDNEPDVAHLFRLQLEKEGYRVSVVTQASRVLDIARQLQPELITLDLLMDMDGLTILSQLKADAQTASIPVVIVSVVPDAEKGMALGAVDYLLKPLKEGQLLSCVRRVLAESDSGLQGKILVVDDERDIVGWLKHVLTHHGFSVTEAYDGVQALEAVAADRPDLILLDLKMPRMDGRATIRRLREQEDTRSVPIIVFTATQLSDEAERAQMLGMGVKEFLHKSVTMEQLVGEVRKYVGESRANQGVVAAEQSAQGTPTHPGD